MDEKAILKHFDNVFNTKTEEHIKLNMPMLKFLLRHYIEEFYTPSPKYKNLLVKSNEQIGVSLDALDNQQKKLFENCFDTVYTMLEEQEEQVFLFGYILAKEFDNEGNLNILT